MEMQEIIDRAARNIRTALSDYGEYTPQTDVLDDVSDEFIRVLARDSAYAKQDLRELFSKSPVWDAQLDALVINGTRTHNPDYERIRSLAREIFWSVYSNCDNERYYDIDRIVNFFAEPNMSEAEKSTCIESMNRVAPKAYSPTKKLSRVFKAVCVALGVADETAGSEFQRVYTQFADELSAKKIGFKLYVSINPAHFLTMSNPKHDRRGTMLTSCHSFNSTEYEYNNGCSGYARDDTSFIVFTAADPAEPETLNNRKTTRQIFAYRPGSGLLMQSRMYNTSGGVYGAAEDSKLYRDLVQREISALENVPNLWKTKQATNEEWRGLVDEGDGFGGYADWTYDDFDGHISCRTDCDPDSVDPLIVGSWGLCISCGCEINSGLYCDDCQHGSNYCECCEEYVDDELTTAYDDGGNRIQVCQNCLDNRFSYCDECEEYHECDCMSYIDGRSVCDSCRDEYYEECHECNEWHRRDDMTLAHDSRGNEVWVCEDCLDQYYSCDKCSSEYYSMDDMYRAYRENGEEVYVCEDCRDDFVECPHCDELIMICDDGTCPHCGAVVTEEEA